MSCAEKTRYSSFGYLRNNRFRGVAFGEAASISPKFGEPRRDLLP
jgi:hypothetical protein